MGLPVCNTTMTEETVVEDPVFAKVTAHHIVLFVAFVTTCIAFFVSLYSIFNHCYGYTKSWEQKHIIRILIMVPVYALASFMSALYYKHSAYPQVLGDTYAAIAITSFFALLCHYLGPTLQVQRFIFQDIVPRRWTLYLFGLEIPLPVHWICGDGFARPNGSRWFKIVSYGVYQYAVVRILVAIISLITQLTDRFCPGSNNPAFAHIWTNIFNALSATIAQFFLDQLFYQIADQLGDHRPTFKFWCIKSVLIFSQYQTLIVTLLLDFSLLNPSNKASRPDLAHIPASLLCIELAIISVLHLYAFSFKSYREPTPRKKRIRTCCTAMADVLNPMDMVKAMTRGRSWEAIPETVCSVQETAAPDPRSSKEVAQDTVSYVELMERTRSTPRSQDLENRACYENSRHIGGNVIR